MTDGTRTPRGAGSAGRAAGRLVVLADRVGRTGGWRRLLIAFVLGACLAGAMAPVHAMPLVVVAFVGLGWLLDGGAAWRVGAGMRPTRARSLAAGWAFGFGFFLSGLYWIGFSFAMRSPVLALWAPFAIVALCAGLGIFGGLLAGAYQAIDRRFRLTAPARACLLALLWLAIELARGHVLSGFPWNLVAYAWAPVLAVAQGAALVGAYGLGLLTVAAAAAPGAWVAASAGPSEARTRRSAALFVAATWGVLACLGAWGGARLATQTAADVPGVRLRVVQPNIAQPLKWRDDLRARHLQALIDLSVARAAVAPTHVIWPETAIPYNLDGSPGLPMSIGANALTGAGVVIAGIPRVEFARDSQGVDRVARVFNSMAAVDQAGSVVAVYDKVHLVPFGEYMPLRSVLPFGKLTLGSLDFSAGAELATLRLPGAPPASPLICYEVIFPGRVTAPSGGAATRPHWLLNITNDAWFGNSSGPYQHLQSARFRAIEEGVPLVRSANTGISAVIDAYGRILQALPLNDRGFIDAALPGIAASRTPYSEIGQAALLPLALLAMAAILFWRGPREMPAMVD
ncbi:MAG: apolipoprotein N-acyltransferase [Alphaproteobacteria bacterium]|nr:apolipoprotein N-acyltransferase [Alphaproteobacteria bacterium]